MTSPTEQLLPSLIDGDTDGTHALFGGAGEVYDPLSGVIGEPTFYFWAAARYLFLFDRKARLDPVRITRAGSQACVEVVLHLSIDGRAVPLPVAVVGEEAGDTLVRARIYHSTWPIYGRHSARNPILRPDPELHAADVVGRYQQALASGDVEGVLSTLEPDAVVREPSGGEHAYTTPEEHRRFYKTILGRGGIPLDHCRILDDGGACALEYNVVSWGDVELPVPHPGVAVYERSPGGLIQAARIYDDVDPPESVKTG